MAEVVTRTPTDIEAAAREELVTASDATIEDAVTFADPMVLRGLIYQLTGDAGILSTQGQTKTGNGIIARQASR